MKAKIDWYREVLELEPGSKVFFPLARLLAEYGQVQDALSTLRQGLERHPEFIEAHLYLIDLLHKNGMIADCEPQVGKLTRLFSQYPGFWEAWGAWAADGEKQDLSLTLRFLAALFQHPDLDLGQVLERGLYSLAETPETLQPVSEPGTGIGTRTIPPNDAVQASAAIAADVPAPATATAAAAVSISSPAVARATEPDDAEEPFSLRTKSMADVLAGQSDIGGALEIYRELALRAESPEERQEISERIAQLASIPEQTAGVPPPPLPDLVPPPGKQRMRHLLESLAERLEARALG
jgi:tetratricopeptide (TPR) repeat protein